jgi:cellulose biosynthesis protein BcsQ
VVASGRANRFDYHLEQVSPNRARFHKISDAFDHMQTRMGHIIRSVDGQYDQVVIDCAPGLSQLVWGAQ